MVFTLFTVFLIHSFYCVQCFKALAHGASSQGDQNYHFSYLSAMAALQPPEYSTHLVGHTSMVLVVSTVTEASTQDP